MQLVAPAICAILFLASSANADGRLRSAPSKDYSKDTDEQIREGTKAGDSGAFLEAADRRMKDLEPVLRRFAEGPAPEPEKVDNSSKITAVRSKGKNIRAAWKHKWTQRSARIALARMGDDQFLRYFLVASSTGTQADRLSAIDALGSIGSKKVVPDLANLLYDKGGPTMNGPHELIPSVSETAARALGKILPDAAQEITAKQKPPHSPTVSEWKVWWEAKKPLFNYK